MGIRNYSTEIKVGLMVGFAIFIFIVAVLSLGGGSSIFRSQYTLKVKFDTIEGIGTGSVVQLMGIPVGNVSDVQIIPENGKIIVSMRVDKKFQHLITEGSSAGLKTQGALGDKFVLIESGKLGLPPLNDKDFLISRADNDLISTLTGSGDKVSKIFQILDELNTLVKNLNANGRSALFMQNLTDSSLELKKLLGNTNVLVRDLNGQKKIEKAVTHLASVLEKIDNGEGTLGALINDPSIHDGLKSIIGGSERNEYMKGLIRNTIKTGKD